MTVLGSDFIGSGLVVLVAAALALACRWVFSSRGVRTVIGRPDYGLLLPVARFDSIQRAETAKEALTRHGVRGTIVPAGTGFDARGMPWPPDSLMLMVFCDDVELAISLVASETG